ncbi:GNAT family N-acetyltransferase [Pseudalkalibacillus caeni]|uniref:GNAT family N-acetyltransferase n=1 Tax=Exobacillus caeni TaxID=2574798 RepID=A0A5R9EZ39_9BACL|nr:GNAT family N-acetyltransferase [Pseudalkalibacillus caeni]TLS35466.1 GNAT family N-acetyltransferase [Pseudalkalibacillus caeni]
MSKSRLKNTPYTIEIGTEKDMEAILTLLVQAADWLQSKNTDQWSYYLSDLDGNKAEVQESIEKKETYIVKEGSRVIATITLQRTPNDWDMEIWDEEANDEKAIYVHRIVTDRAFAKQNLGDRLLDFAEDYARDNSFSLIRFDCLASNNGLNSYYQKRYNRKEVANIYGAHSKYEKEVF